MRYYTCNDLCEAVYRNIYKIPHDIDCVVGIARSGMIPATIIATLLHKPLYSADGFCSGKSEGCGLRGRYFRESRSNSILLVDDTVFQGNAIVDAVRQIRPHYSGQIITCTAFGEGPGVDKVNIVLQDIRGGNQYLYEWNVFQHNPEFMCRCIYDIDGVLCVNPPDDHNLAAYEAYLDNAVPLITPVSKVGALCTCRLEKYRARTEAWLAKVGVTYGELCMVNLPDHETRARWNRWAEHKAEFYQSKPWAQLFVESSEWEANRIHQMTRKPVLSIETNTLKGQN